jgi:hypothetical protein
MGTYVMAHVITHTIANALHPSQVWTAQTPYALIGSNWYSNEP